MARAARCNRLCNASLGSANRRMPESGCEVASVASGEVVGMRSSNWLGDFSATCGAEAQAVKSTLNNSAKHLRCARLYLICSCEKKETGVSLGMHEVVLTKRLMEADEVDGRGMCVPSLGCRRESIYCHRASRKMYCHHLDFCGYCTVFPAQT